MPFHRGPFIYSIAVTAVAVGASLGTTTVFEAKRSIDSLTVHRINVVDNDGTLRLLISNRENFPPDIVRGKVLDPKARIVSDQASFMFYNRDGSEQGGMRWDGTYKDGGNQIFSLTMDQLEQNENLILVNGEDKGQRFAHLAGQSRPDPTALNLLDAQLDAAVAKGKTEAEKRQISHDFIAKHFLGQERFYIGYGADGSSLRLGDQNGKPRLVIRVNKEGNPTIQFLDASGHVTKEIS